MTLVSVLLKAVAEMLTAQSQLAVRNRHSPGVSPFFKTHRVSVCKRSQMMRLYADCVSESKTSEFIIYRLVDLVAGIADPV
jgi:hypothetical protein